MSSELFAIDHLFTFDEVTAVLHDLAEKYPALVSVEEIGRSFEGREIWLATVTNTESGAAADKPAVWVDANIHSGEITGSMAALHLIRTLVERRDEPQTAHVLATRTFYVLPRVNPDGAELALANDPTHLRSSVRPSRAVVDEEGWVPFDIDGDGRVLDLRIVDPNGSWKVSELDDRIVVPRQPEDIGDGPYYRIVHEGRYRSDDDPQLELKPAPDRRTLDMNRHFPYGWADESVQHGAGKVPVFEPEIRSLIDAVMARPNICVYIAHHTFSAAILRPYDDKPDSAFPRVDLVRYKALGEKGTELTSYKAVSVFHDFGYDDGKTISGAADTWAYDHLGIFGFTTEFWSPIAQAGITDYHFTEWFEDHPIEDEVALLKWSDEELGGASFAPWTPFDHPQLGEVEIGGWDHFNTWQNAPGDRIEGEVAPHTDWEIWLALTTPLLAIRETAVEAVGDGVYSIRAVVENTGHFPTNVTEKAIERKSCLGVVAKIELPEGVELATGAPAQELGQLNGHDRVRSPMGWGEAKYDYSSDRAVATWTVTGKPGTELTVTASHDRAGRAAATVVLP